MRSFVGERDVRRLPHETSSNRLIDYTELAAVGTASLLALIEADRSISRFRKWRALVNLFAMQYRPVCFRFPILFATVLLAAPLVAQAAAPSLVPNGDFEAGQLAPFNSFFTRSSEMTAPSTWNSVSHDTLNPSWLDFFDHTRGDANGHFFVSNGPENFEDHTVFILIDLQPNTEYKLSGWVAAVSSDAPDRLGVRIFNASAMITYREFSMPSTPGVWQPFALTFNSFGGRPVSAFFSGTGSLRSNDFALDDISLTIPEPSAATLLALALGGHVLFRRRRRSAASVRNDK